MEELEMMHGLDAEERALFQTKFNRREKSPVIALLLTFFLGGVGGHRFYLGQVGWGVLYLLFFWTFIPAIVAFIELFVIMGRTREYNRRVAREIRDKIRALEPGED